MKNLTKIFMIMAVALLPLSIEAQDVSALVKLSKEYSQLETQITELNALIKQEEEKSFSLRSSWYNTCKTYLQKGQFKADELESLINQTIPEIDGQELYDELLYAKECFDKGKEYQYKDIQVPTRDIVVTPVASSESKSKENNTRNDDDKNTDKKPVVDNDAEKMDRTPKQEEPIVTDPSKDRNGEDKPSVPVKEKESDKDEKTTPVTTPMESDSKSSNPSKVEKKRNKGDMEEGTSKKSKNNDGSR